MKSIILKGVEVKIGDTVRFINNVDLYVGGFDGFDRIIKPVVGKVYTVRGFSDLNGFYLEEIKNSTIEYIDNDIIYTVEPGFGFWRFEPANPLIAEVKEVASKNKKVSIKIEKEIIEKSERMLELSRN